MSCHPWEVKGSKEENTIGHSRLRPIDELMCLIVVLALEVFVFQESVVLTLRRQVNSSDVSIGGESKGYGHTLQALPHGDIDLILRPPTPIPPRNLQSDVTDSSAFVIEHKGSTHLHGLTFRPRKPNVHSDPIIISVRN